MDLLWAIPAVMGVVGIVVLIVGFRLVARNAGELRLQLHRLDEVRLAIAEVRTTGADTRAAIEQLRSRR